MKEFHIISSGVSLITNAQKAGLIPKDIRIDNEEYWKSLLSNPDQIKELVNFLKKNPREVSAELNTFLRAVEGKNPSQIEIYLFGTKTASNELCRRVIESYLKEVGYKIYTPYEVSGYFHEAYKYDEKYATDEFQRGICELLDRLLYLAKNKKKEGYEVYFNPTGGLKAHVIATAIAGFLIGAPVYYMHEEFRDIIFLPRILYLPKGKEIEVIKSLWKSKIISGPEVEKFYRDYPEEMERLELYNLIEVECDENTLKPYRLKLTNKGKFLVENLLK